MNSLSFLSISIILWKWAMREKSRKQSLSLSAGTCWVKSLNFLNFLSDFSILKNFKGIFSQTQKLVAFKFTNTITEFYHSVSNH